MTAVPQRAPTIDDVAARCGVATSTVSRAFSRPGRVSAATRELVLATAAAMGYRPNPIARALPSGRTRTLGLLVPDITNPFFLHLLRGAERQAADAGYTLVLADTEEAPDQELTVFDRLRGSVDGYVLASSRMTDEALREAYERTPLVVINRQVPPVPGVVIDSAAGTVQALEHLAELGHRRIGYLAGPATSWSNAQRWNALRSAVRRLSKAYDGLSMRRFGSAMPTVEGGEAVADTILDSDVTAVLTFNDLLAIGLLRRSHWREVPLPERLSVVGCDDIFGAEVCTPELTTLTAPLEDAGRSAVDLLLAKLRAPDEPLHEISLPTRLTIRQSTQTVAPREPVAPERREMS